LNFHQHYLQPLRIKDSRTSKTNNYSLGIQFQEKFPSQFIISLKEEGLEFVKRLKLLKKVKVGEETMHKAIYLILILCFTSSSMGHIHP